MTNANREVLERTGDGSRTQSANTERLVRYLDSLGAEKSKPRPMEAVWALTALVLLAIHLESSDVSSQVIAEKKECQIAKERSGQYARALTTLLNEKPIVIGETTRVSCRVREIAS